MTDWSVTHPLSYVALTTACWAVPAVTLVWGVLRLRQWRNRPCQAHFEAGPTTVFHCVRRHRHRGAHADLTQKPYSFEWYDHEQEGLAPRERSSP